MNHYYFGLLSILIAITIAVIAYIMVSLFIKKKSLQIIPLTYLLAASIMFIIMQIYLGDYSTTEEYVPEDRISVLSDDDICIVRLKGEYNKKALLEIFSKKSLYEKAINNEFKIIKISHYNINDKLLSVKYEIEFKK